MGTDGPASANTQTIDDPRFAAETDTLLDRLGGGDPDAAYANLLASRTAQPDPELAGRPDPRARQFDLHLPLRGGPRRVRLYRGGDADRQPLVLWLHGGGFVGGSVASIDALCAGLAVRAGATLVSLDYRLAPEDPFPAGLHDTYDALQWLTEYGEEIRGDGRVVAGGMSAGATLVAAACLLARDRGSRLPAAQILCYPVVDFDQETESLRQSEDPLLNPRGMAWMRDQYLAELPVTPYAAPLRADSLSGLPPALVVGGSRDPLRDDAHAYARRLRADAVAVTHVEYADTGHAFLSFPAALSAARHAIELIAGHIADSATPK